MGVISKMLHRMCFLSCKRILRRVAVTIKDSRVLVRL